MSYPKDIDSMNWDETEAALARISFQFKIIHELPKIPGLKKKDDRKVAEYMHDALHGLRLMCIELHWRRIAIVSKKQARP